MFGFIEGWLIFLPKTVHRNKLPTLSHSDFMSIFSSILFYISISIKAEQLLMPLFTHHTFVINIILFLLEYLVYKYNSVKSLRLILILAI